MLDKVKKNIPNFFKRRIEYIVNANGKESKYKDLREYTTITLQLRAKLIMVMCTCIDKIQ